MCFNGLEYFLNANSYPPQSSMSSLSSALPKTAFTPDLWIGPCGPILLPCLSHVLHFFVLMPSPLTGVPLSQPLLQHLCSGLRPHLLSMGLSLLLLVGICVIASQSESHRVGRDGGNSGVQWWGHQWQSRRIKMAPGFVTYPWVI